MLRYQVQEDAPVTFWFGDDIWLCEVTLHSEQPRIPCFWRLGSFEVINSEYLRSQFGEKGVAVLFYSIVVSFVI